MRTEPSEKPPLKRPAPRPLTKKKKAPWDTESFLNKLEGGSPRPTPQPEPPSEAQEIGPPPEPQDVELQSEAMEVEKQLALEEDVRKARTDDLFGSPLSSDDEEEQGLDSTTFIAEYVVPTKASRHYIRRMRKIA
jgi:hypothetical protein